MKTLIPFLLIAFLSGGCTSYMELKPAGDDPATFKDGSPLITSTEAESLIIITPGLRQYESTQEISFLVHAENRGTDPIVMDATNVTATAGDKELKVWTYDQRMKKARRDAAWAQFGAAMAAAADGMNQQRTTTYGNANTNVYGNTANTSYTGSTQTTGISQAEANRRAKSRSDAIATGLKSMRAEAETILSTTTLQPGEHISGGLILSRPKVAGPVDLEIQMGDDLHSITFDYQPIE